MIYSRYKGNSQKLCSQDSQQTQKTFLFNRCSILIQIVAFITDKSGKVRMQIME